MVFSKLVEVADIISCVSLVFLAVGGVATWLQWKKDSTTRRIDYIKEISDDISHRDRICEGFYILDDKSHLWFEDVVSGKNECLVKQIDATLMHFSYICYLRKVRAISKAEFFCFCFYIDTIISNNQVLDYFYREYHKHNQDKNLIPFRFLFLYLEKKRFKADPDLAKRFYNKTLHNISIDDYEFHDPAFQI